MSGQDTFFSSTFSLNLRGELLDLSTPRVMGILNLTPDSFFDGGQFNSAAKAIEQCKKMLDEGADIIDIGAASSRPGSEVLSAHDEWNRMSGILSQLVKEFPNAYFSIDTFHSTVAEKAIDNGAHIINDISGGEMDPKMYSIAAQLKCPLIVMHMQGTPQNMQDNPKYSHVVIEIIQNLQAKVFRAHEAGVLDLIIDPGFGFGKTVEHNFQILNQLDHFHLLKCPILAGLSRKSMIYKSLNSSSDEALNGTTALNMIAMEKGARLLRVHDVKEAKECVSLFTQLKAHEHRTD